MQEAARVYRVDYELLQALIAAESAFNTNAVSVKGAIGLMQIMPDTARRFGFDSDRWASIETKLTDPKTNIRIGTRYLRLLMDMFPGQLDLVLASYNAGEGAVQKAGNAVPKFKETQNYVAVVMQLYAVLKPPALTPAMPVKLAGKNTGRVRAQFLAPGGATGRGNMVTPLHAAHTSSPLAVD
jgi:soluble lytic murein transglycosylase-like protein